MRDDLYLYHNIIILIIIIIIIIIIKVKVKQSRYRSGVVQRVPGISGSKIS